MKAFPIHIALWVVMALGALLFRVTGLDRRPLHHDEANQAVRFGMLLEDGCYAYDPKDHHGPTLYYLTCPVARIASASKMAELSETMLRLVPAIFGTGLILLFPLLGQGAGRHAILFGALLAAFSPAMVYYSRFYIQEMLLAFFTLGALAAGWQYVRKGSLSWAVAAGLCLGLMFATKETSVIAMGAMAGAGFLTWLWRRAEGREEPGGWSPKPIHVAAAVAAAVLIAVLFFSSFFTHWRGPLDSVLSFGHYARRTVGNAAHAHPWHWYLQLLSWSQEARGAVWSEGFILLLALVGAGVALAGKGGADANRHFLRFMVFYAVLMTAVYSVIPYKTAWCLVQFLVGLIVLAGVGAAALGRMAGTAWLKGGLALLLAAGALHLAWQARELSTRYEADPSNPYVYAQTSRDFMRLVERVEALARLSPAGKDVMIGVVASPYGTWPLPWYLRAYRHVGYWPTPEDVPKEGVFPLMIVHSDFAEAAAARVGPECHQEFYGLRPDVLLVLLVRTDLWEKFIETVR